MAWRTVVIENPAKLSLKDNKLVILQDEEIHVPLEDIDSLVVDQPAITFTEKLLLALTEHKIAVFLSDEKHLPAATILPYSQASRGVKNAKAQLNLAESTRKQLWRKNIMAKIKNQADVLAKFDLKNDDLLELARTVRSGDAGNSESTAARLYFARLLEDSTRRKPMWYNSALNYGYALIRGSIARSVASHGLVSMVGINHRSELNQYNLVDDLIESVRPIVDDFILSVVAPRHIGNLEDSSLTTTDRHLILDIFDFYGIIEGKKYPVRIVTDKIVDSFVTAILEDSVDSFILPEIVK